MARKCRVRVENVDVFVAPRVPLRTPEPRRRAGDGLPRRSRPSPRRRSREGLVANDCALWERRTQIWTSNETGGFTLSRDDVIRYRGSSFLRHLRCLLIKAFDQAPKQWSARSFPLLGKPRGLSNAATARAGQMLRIRALFTPPVIKQNRRRRRALRISRGQRKRRCCRKCSPRRPPPAQNVRGGGTQSFCLQR